MGRPNGTCHGNRAMKKKMINAISITTEELHYAKKQMKVLMNNNCEL
jgi:hypothetical protein